MAIGLTLMRQLTATTDYPVMFLWMFITGLGIGPTLSVFTIIVQNAVPFSVLGVATSNLTFFRQIGGTVGPRDRRHGLRQLAAEPAADRDRGQPAPSSCSRRPSSC